MGRGRRGARPEQAQQCVIRATIDGCKMSVRDWESFMRVVQAERVRNVGRCDEGCGTAGGVWRSGRTSFTSTRNVLRFLQRSLRDEIERVEEVQKGKIEVMC